MKAGGSAKAVETADAAGGGAPLAFGSTATGIAADFFGITLAESLKRSGILVLDYFNSEKIVRNLAHQEVKQVDGIEFYITKKVSNGNIIKSISFEHKSKNFSYLNKIFRI